MLPAIPPHDIQARYAEYHRVNSDIHSLIRMKEKLINHGLPQGAYDLLGFQLREYAAYLVDCGY